jgi:2-deoxy-D-gluconate 3-dehydrogenase
MSALFKLDGKTALVTGGHGRIGAAIGQALTNAGAEVIVSGRGQADVTNDAQLDTLFGGIAELDILVNCAGRASAEQLGSITRDEFNAVLDLNVTSALLCAQHAVPLMEARGGGKIVNVGSIYGTVGGNRSLYEGLDMVQASAAYVASKSALVNLTRDLAVQLAPLNIQVNMLSPGGVEAGQPEEFQERYRSRTPAGRMATPEDMAGTAVYLASAASDYVTGQNILVDGGFTSW